MSDFKMTPKPADMSDTGIHKLFDDELKPAIAIALALDRLERVMHKPPVPTVAELFFHTNRRRDYTFEQVPWGHGLGWRCYDPNKYDGDPADGDTTCGYGKTQDEAYVDYLHALDDADATPKKVAPLLYSGGDEPNDYGTPVRVTDPDEE